MRLAKQPESMARWNRSSIARQQKWMTSSKNMLANSVTRPPKHESRGHFVCLRMKANRYLRLASGFLRLTDSRVVPERQRFPAKPRYKTAHVLRGAPPILRRLCERLRD